PLREILAGRREPLHPIVAAVDDVHRTARPDGDAARLVELAGAGPGGTAAPGPHEGTGVVVLDDAVRGRVGDVDVAVGRDCEVVRVLDVAGGRRVSAPGADEAAKRRLSLVRGGRSAGWQRGNGALQEQQDRSH